MKNYEQNLLNQIETKRAEYIAIKRNRNAFYHEIEDNKPKLESLALEIQSLRGKLDRYRKYMKGEQI